MQKLTLDQAANELGIKRASVYKRTQRGTLPFTRESDGQLYVYIDNERATDKASGVDERTDNADAGDAKKERPWWDIIAEVSGLVVVLGLTVYVLGLFTLWAPIVRTYTHDAVTAWYAVSLVPRPVVAGLGTRQLIAFPLFATITMVTLFFAVYALIDVLFGEGRRNFTAASLAVVPVYGLVLLYGGWRIAANFPPGLNVPQWRLALSFGLLLLFGYFAIIGPVWIVDKFRSLLARNEGGCLSWFSLINYSFIMLIWCGLLFELFYWTLPSVVDEPSSLLRELRIAGADDITDTVIISVAALIVGFVAPFGLVLFTSQLADRRRRHEDDPAARRIFPIVGFAVILFSSFLAAFMLTFVGDPPLATVDIDGSRSVKGALLTHADGYWYVFNTTKGKLVAVPDDGVTDVNICKPTTGPQACSTRTRKNHPTA